ncbi:YesN/AraC family two-component response regulator [Mucilaginibacter rubeus]|uniref:hypothetical protein n=1 Tax=Mucilaginibacter rubeus TaxID=2027860 RepID=UPI003397AD47
MLSMISSDLILLGFDILKSEQDQLLGRIKNLVIERVHHQDLQDMTTNFPTYLAEKLDRDYAYLSRMFFNEEGITIKRYIIQQKIEKVKELLEYGQLNLNEIPGKWDIAAAPICQSNLNH